MFSCFLIWNDWPQRSVLYSRACTYLSTRVLSVDICKKNKSKLLFLKLFKVEFLFMSRTSDGQQLISRIWSVGDNRHKRIYLCYRMSQWLCDSFALIWLICRHEIKSRLRITITTNLNKSCVIYNEIKTHRQESVVMTSINFLFTTRRRNHLKLDDIELRKSRIVMNTVLLHV